TAPAGQVGTQTEYDTVGRAWRITPPPGDADSPTGSQVIDFNVNTNNPWMQKVTDAKGKYKTMYFDAHGRTVTMVEHAAPDVVTTFTYDALGNLHQVMDHLGHTTTIFYDGLGHKTELDDPDSGTWFYKFDSTGRLTYQTDADHHKTLQFYDAAGRISRRELYA